MYTCLYKAYSKEKTNPKIAMNKVQETLRF